MAPRPTPGGDYGSWGTEMNAHLDVSLDAEGGLRSAAIAAALPQSAVASVATDTINAMFTSAGSLLYGSSIGLAGVLTAGTNRHQLGIRAGIPTWLKKIVFDVDDYGAVGDGSANDRAAVQATIDAAVANGGGVVWFRRAEFKIQITTNTAVDHLTIGGSFVTLCGEPGAKLSFYTFGGDPDTHFQVISGAVHRGHGISITGGANYAARTRNVVIADLELDGNFTATGDHSWPANTSTGAGWDTTHHGVTMQTLYYEDITVDHCHIHNFSGELVYSGGDDSGATPALGKMTVKNSTIHDTNGSAVSMTSRHNIVCFNEIYNCFEGVENGYKGGRYSIFSNNIHDTESDGISMISWGEGNGSCNVYDNWIHQTGAFGIGLMSAWNASVHNNHLVDCPSGFFRLELGFGYPNDYMNNVDIFDNLGQADTMNTIYGVSIGIGADLKNVRIMRNRFNSTPAGATAGFGVTAPLWCQTDTDLSQVALSDNEFKGVQGDTSLSRSIDKLLTSTSPAYPSQYKARMEIGTLLQFSVFVRVVTGATNVTIKIHDGSNYIATVLSTTSLAVGNYSFPAYTALIGPNANSLIEVTAGTANRVYVSSNIQEV